MKKISLLLVAGALWLSPVVQAQDRAVEERLDKLEGHIQDLLAAQAVQQKRIAALARDLQSLQEQVAKPTGNYASQEDLKKLAESLRDIDQKRIADNQKILEALEALKKAGAAPRPEKVRTPSARHPSSSGPEKGFEYVIQSGDTLSAISMAYREKGIKVSPDQILKANPGIKATSLQVGQKIFIPAQ